jgi:hypothetical protein
MRCTAFTDPGRFWRGNLHTHSTRSDGKLGPEQVCDLYRSARYDFLALTDHFLENYGYPLTDTRPFRTPEFTTLIGAELHTGFTEFGQRWHILAVGLPFDFQPYPPDETGPEVAARALEAGAYVVAVHPSWYGLTEQDILSLGPIHAVEIYNATSDDHSDRADSSAIFDSLLMRGHRYTACATDDMHGNPARADALRGWVWVKSEANEPDSLLDALKRGAYYSSTGPQIHDISIQNDTVTVHCSPAERVFLTGHGSLAASVYGNGMTRAELSLSGFRSPYFRVVVRDRSGGRAWSNPVWMAD